MKNNISFSPEESIRLIYDTIARARDRFEAHGRIFLFWGILIALASFGQYALTISGHARESWYPYLLIPAGFVYTYVYFKKHSEPGPGNPFQSLMAVLWTVIGLNMMLLGFLFGAVLKTHLLPVILLLQGIGMVISGGLLRSKILWVSGLIINMAAFVSLALNPTRQALLAGIIALTCIAFPGWLLMKKRNNHV